MKIIRLALFCAVIATATSTTGCASFAITALGIGGTAGVNEAMNGAAYRTFTAPVSSVRLAVLEALRKMDIKVEQKQDNVIAAAANHRNIKIELETISPSSTRVRTVAKKNIFSYDLATANEIIEQTEKSLGSQMRAALYR